MTHLVRWILCRMGFHGPVESVEGANRFYEICRTCGRAEKFVDGESTGIL